MKKKLFYFLLPLCLYASPAANEEPRDCNFFISEIQDKLGTWNSHYRSQQIEVDNSTPYFLERYKHLYKSHLYAYAAKRELDSESLTKYESHIDTIFAHLSTYYRLLELYGNTCFGVTEQTPYDAIPQIHHDYIKIIQNECSYLSMLMLRHCEWGGGDNSLVGNGEHYERIEQWNKKYLETIPCLPTPPTVPSISRIAKKLSENTRTQFDINFSLYEPEKIANIMAFAYTNLLANIHFYGDTCPLREHMQTRAGSEKEEINYNLAGALIVRQQDEWSRIISFGFKEFFMPDELASYGSGSGVQTEDFVNRQLALLNYLSGDLLYPQQEETTEADEISDVPPATSETTDTTSTRQGASPALKPAYFLPPFFIVSALLLCWLLTPRPGRQH